MFNISYNSFTNNDLYADFSTSYMPGLTVHQISSARVIINIDCKTAYVFSD